MRIYTYLFSLPPVLLYQHLPQARTYQTHTPPNPGPLVMLHRATPRSHSKCHNHGCDRDAIYGRKPCIHSNLRCINCIRQLVAYIYIYELTQFKGIAHQPVLRLTHVRLHIWYIVPLDIIFNMEPLGNTSQVPVHCPWQQFEYPHISAWSHCLYIVYNILISEWLPCCKMI